MNAILCALALLSPGRSESRIGAVEASFKWSHGQCVEYVTRIGSTWLEDEDLWIRVVDSEMCLEI